MKTEGYERAAEFYDYIVPYVERRDVEFYLEEARRAGGEVLELGCGTGRILIPVARNGVRVTGLDSSAGMLARLRAKLAAEPPEVQARVRVIEGDMRSFRLAEHFPLITMPFRSFQHLLEVEDQLACLEAVRQHLAEEGRLVMDVFDPWLEKLVEEKPSEPMVEAGTQMPDGRRLERVSRVVAHHRDRQVIEVEMTHYLTDGAGRMETVVERFPMRYFYRYEIEHLLARAGLRVEALYCDFDRSPFGARYPADLVLACGRG